MKSNLYKHESVPSAPHLSTTPTSSETQNIGIILVDHGSRREESNILLQQMANLLSSHAPWQIIEIAHMELASPTIAEAFASCVQKGAQRIVVFPYFLSPGRHWKHDIPTLTAQAAQAFPQIPFLVTAPIGVDPLLSALIQQRIQQCLHNASQHNQPCPYCLHQTERCRFHNL